MDPSDREPNARWYLVIALLAALTGCLQPNQTQCSDGRICPGSLVCDDVHGGCLQPDQLTACEGKVEGEMCSYGLITQAECRDGICIDARCGNGHKDPGELCDDGNTLSGDDCSADCRSLETCGNGYVDAALGEQCDDGNLIDGDETGCQSTCLVARCGDGVVDNGPGEECDLGTANANTPDAPCRTNCTVRRCGDTVVDAVAGEVCDDGNGNATDDCTPDCLSTVVCGNDYVDFLAGEQCDDANTRSHDGCTNTCTFEAPIWTQRTQSPAGRTGAGLTYDASHGHVVMFGGFISGTGLLSETWQWDGAGWWRLSPPITPPARFQHAIAYDAKRANVVLFGGQLTASVTGDTWVWDGAHWSARTLTVAPSARRSHAMVYDAGRKKVVLFGGASTMTNMAPSAYLGDTWEWDGTAWANVTPSGTSPSARANAALAYDPVRGKVVLFGGNSGTSSATPLGDTWEWDGAAWSPITPTGTPAPARYTHGMTYDAVRARVLLFGGTLTGGTAAGDTWEWDGAAWSQITPTTSPAPRTNLFFTYDSTRRKAILFGGLDASLFKDTWSWDGTDWTLVSPVAPPGRMGHAMAGDVVRGSVVLFGGYDGATRSDTWEWNGDTWIQKTPASAPPAARYNSAMAYDSAARKTVLFGGRLNVSTLTNDTWYWDGADWQQQTPSGTLPSIRERHALAYDAARDRVVLFGGDSSGTLQQDTWEWNGTSWLPITPVGSKPPTRSGHGMAYDARRKVVVLFGGFGPKFDTWEWNGTTWTDRTTLVSPPARDQVRLAYDSVRGRVVLYGGGTATAFSDTWEWDGTAWTQLSPMVSAGSRSFHALAYDGVRGEVVSFGAFVSPSTYQSDTWTLRYDAPVLEDGCRFGRDGDLDGLVGCMDPDCAQLCDPVCDVLGDCTTASRPRCGDGNCDPLETYRLCPADCTVTALCGDYFCEGAETMVTCPGDCAP